MLNPIPKMNQEIKETDSGICIDNFKANGVRKGKYGVALLVNDTPCETSVVFTKNYVKSASLLVTREKIQNKLQAVVINSGCANTCVKQGVKDAERMCNLAGEKLGIDSGNIGVGSTGKIGQSLDMPLIEELISESVSRLSGNSKLSGNLSGNGSLNAAKAIMTTDTFPKQISVEYKGIKIGGIAKGAGMISPDLATMLCFLTTNANLSRDDLQSSLKKSADKSFNMLVIDDDMSTNDMVLLMSNRKQECAIGDFQFLLDYVTTKLARMMAKDGEGATKFIELELKGVETEEKAKIGAKSIISSSLVKTTLFGENPNWGRIIAALGSKVEFDWNKTDIIFESSGKRVVVVENGVEKDIASAKNILKDKEIKIIVDLNSGDERAVAYGCDLTPEYVRINAGY